MSMKLGVTWVTMICLTLGSVTSRLPFFRFMCLLRYVCVFSFYLKSITFSFVNLDIFVRLIFTFDLFRCTVTLTWMTTCYCRTLWSLRWVIFPQWCYYCSSCIFLGQTQVLCLIVVFNLTDVVHRNRGLSWSRLVRLLNRRPLELSGVLPLGVLQALLLGAHRCVVVFTLSFFPLAVVALLPELIKW
jgi:hypothetical protein